MKSANRALEWSVRSRGSVQLRRQVRDHAHDFCDRRDAPPNAASNEQRALSLTDQVKLFPREGDCLSISLKV